MQLTDEIAQMREALEAAVDRLLSLAEQGVALTKTQPPDADAIEAVFVEVMQACAFQDLVGQRLDRLAARLTDRIDDRPDAHLLNGPASGAEGLDQSAADRWLQVG